MYVGVLYSWYTQVENGKDLLSYTYYTVYMCVVVYLYWYTCHFLFLVEMV